MNIEITIIWVLLLAIISLVILLNYSENKYMKLFYKYENIKFDYHKITTILEKENLSDKEKIDEMLSNHELLPF